VNIDQYDTPSIPPKLILYNQQGGPPVAEKSFDETTVVENQLLWVRVSDIIDPPFDGNGIIEYYPGSTGSAQIIWDHPIVGLQDSQHFLDPVNMDNNDFIFAYWSCIDLKSTLAIQNTRTAMSGRLRIIFYEALDGRNFMLNPIRM